MQGRRPRAMNPAFAAAHGIQSKKDGSSSQSSNNALEGVLKRALESGKLVAPNCPGLEVPLQDALFLFPFGVGGYTEDLLTVVDFSDNEEKLGNSVLDERILKYRSVKSLRFRNCGLRLPPPESTWSFSSLEHLTILDLSGNKLDGTFDVGHLLWSPDKVSHLTELNLSNNQIQKIIATNSSTTNAISVALPHLRTLNVSHNPPLQRLFDETKGTFSCETLRILRCHHNPNLSSVASNGSLFTFLDSSRATLEVLEVSHNPKLGNSVSIDLSEFEKLETVQFAMNKLETAPRVSHSVKTLDLRSNKLSSLTGMLPNAPSSELVDLFLNDNYLTDLDSVVVEKMTKLKRLDLFSNKLRALPYQLGFLTELIVLNISGNPVTTRFSSVANDPKNPKPLLETLRKRAPTDNYGNHVSSATIGNASNRSASNLLMAALSTKGNATIDLAGKLTGTTSSSTVALQGLVQELKSKTDIDRRISGQIVLDSNQLESLPEELFSACLPSVQTISLTNNNLSRLPVSLQFSRSKFIQHLRLGKNKLNSDALKSAFWFQSVTSSPPSLSWSLKSLTHLDLSSNKLTSFPIDTSSRVNCFPALEVLNLFNNKISSLDDWKRLPESLAVLDLSENSIEDIEPLSVLLAGCSGLKRLSLVHNNVRIIPASLGLLSEYARGSIVSVNLQGNPQRGLPTFVLEKSSGELLKYLANRLTPAQRKAMIEKIEHHKQQASQEEEPVSQEMKDVVTTISESSPPPLSTAVTEKIASDCPSASCSNDDGGGDEDEQKLLKELKASVEKLKIDLEDSSLTNAKKYAVKKALAMERSKLIREERRLGLRK